MSRRVSVVGICALLLAAMACSRHSDDPQLVVEIPSGFTGNFLLEMGVRGADPLAKQGDAYTVTADGKISTSTVVEKPKIVFKNQSEGGVWGFSESVFTTGDGISVGGKIEFFVGTQKQYEAEQGKKNHSVGKPAVPSQMGVAPV